jgi:DNA-directed RNA polymerase subunit H (RpoH/RPB5)
MQNTLLEKISTSRKYILEIMNSAGYENTLDYSNASFNEVSIMIKNNELDMILYKNIYSDNESNIEKQKVYIKYFIEKLDENKINGLIETVFYVKQTLNPATDILFIIINEETKTAGDPFPNDNLKKILIHIYEKEGIFVVVESLKRLQFNILNHELVPEHVIMTKQEVNLWLSINNNIGTTDKLPQISRFDPIARVLCMKPGQVCKIIRPSEPAITAPYYRVCMNI